MSKKTLFISLEEVGPKSEIISDTKFRNVRILMYYQALQDIKPNLKYHEKVELTAKRFELSFKSIDRIICDFVKKEGE